jgi:hypothetical protein
MRRKKLLVAAIPESQRLAKRALARLGDSEAVSRCKVSGWGKRLAGPPLTDSHITQNLYSCGNCKSSDYHPEQENKQVSERTLGGSRLFRSRFCPFSADTARTRNLNRGRE